MMVVGACGGPEAMCWWFIHLAGCSFQWSGWRTGELPPNQARHICVACHLVLLRGLNSSGRVADRTPMATAMDLPEECAASQERETHHESGLRWTSLVRHRDLFSRAQTGILRRQVSYAGHPAQFHVQWSDADVQVGHDWPPGM